DSVTAWRRFGEDDRGEPGVLTIFTGRRPRRHAHGPTLEENEQGGVMQNYHLVAEFWIDEHKRTVAGRGPIYVRAERAEPLRSDARRPRTTGSSRSGRAARRDRGRRAAP